ncbi:MAG: CPBP family intramembrane metalloprotease [Planctomycetaceae bacterium]|nr:CPBP family intramembrane metalloprotease [Planctomycetaceae bacterium]
MTVSQGISINDREGFLTYSFSFLLVLLLLTMWLAWLLDVQPIRTIHWSLQDFAMGSLAALGMMAAFSAFGSVRQQAEDILGPMLARCHWYDLLVLATFVGIVEELLFRGLLEQWLSRVDPWFAFFAVNILFGLLHAVSAWYAVLAAILGGILSLLAQIPGEYNLLRPIVAHGLYDYIGFLWVARAIRRRQVADEFPQDDLPEKDYGNGKSNSDP